MENMTAEVVDVKGAFLKGDREDGEEIHMQIPQGWEHRYDDNEVLKLKSCLYGLKQAAMAFLRQLVKCVIDMETKRSTADDCLYFNWTGDGLALVISWIDDNLIIGNTKAVARTKKNLTTRFDCEECGELDEYVGCKITRIGKSALKITQPVIIQSFSDEFDLPNHGCPTPVRMGNVLTKAGESDLLGPKEHAKYRSGVEK